MKTRIIIGFISVFTIYGLNAQNLGWPTDTPAQQAQITGTVGEYREDGGNVYRWHAGVDISPLIEVHAMNGGTAYWNEIDGSNSMVYIENANGEIIEYIHVVPTETIENNTTDDLGTTVNSGDQIGTTYNMSGRHLHLELGDVAGGAQNSNFLNSRLNPYVDNSSPFFRTNSIDDGLEFYRNGLNAGTPNPATLEMTRTVLLSGTTNHIIYGKVDIVTDIVDHWTASTGNSAGAGQLAPFGFEWTLMKDNVIVYEGDLEFNQFPDNQNALYGFHPSSSSPGNPSIYILTVDPYNGNIDTRDRWWNTALVLNQQEDWSMIPNRTQGLDATINELSELQDGLYDFTFNAYDVEHGTNPNNRLQEAIEKNLLIDNFKPYIKQLDIAISDDGSSYAHVYTGEWIWDISERWIEFSSSGDPTIAPSDYVEFTVHTSEPMEWIINEPTIEIDGAATPPTLISVSDSDEFTFVMTPGNFDLSGLDNGTKTITINGYDLAGNQITGFDQLDNALTDEELPHRLGETQWSGTLASKTDTRHVLHVGGSSCDPPGGRASESNCPLVADFTQEPDFSNPKTIYFTDRSVPDGEITNWSWDFGDGFTTSVQNPTHTYEFVGDYPVTLTVSRGVEQDSWTSIITVTSEPLLANFTMTPNSGSAPLNVSLNSSNSQGNIISWYWDITPPSGHQFIIGNQNTENPTVSFTESGEYSITLTINNDVASHTSNSQSINVSPGSFGDTEVNFYWVGQAYAGGQIQFFDDSFIKCIGGSPTYHWNIYEFSSTRFDVAGNLPNPFLTFTEFGNAEVELCIEDGCGQTYCSERKLVEVLDGSEANKNVYASFAVIEGSIGRDVGETIRLADYSYGENGDQIKGWDYWWDLPDGASQGGPVSRYDTEWEHPWKDPTVNNPEHVYDVPGKYRVRSYVYKDREWISYNYFETDIIIRRSAGFCDDTFRLGQDEYHNEEEKIFTAGSNEKEIAGIMEFYELADVIVESGANVEFIGTGMSINPSEAYRQEFDFTRARVHFQQGSTVHLKTVGCEELRITFED